MATEQDTPKEVLSNKRSFYVEATRRIRWLVIVLVVMTFPYESFGIVPFLSLITGAAIYNIGWYWPRLRDRSWFGSFVSMNIMDNLFMGVLIVLSGGFASPYYLLFSFMAITASYWFGYKGLSVLAAFHAVFALGLWRFMEPVMFDLDVARVALVLIATFIINGVLIERLTYGDRAERSFAVKAKKEIETERQRLLSLINSIGDGVIAVSHSGEVLLYNGAALDLLDTNEQLLGNQLSQYLRLYDEDGEAVDITQLARSSQGLVKRRDLMFKDSDDNTVNIDLTLSPIMSTEESDDIEGGYIVILRDITKEKSLDEAKDEFVSVTSHELRTPIAIAEANLSTALLPKLAPENSQTKDLLDKAYDNIVFLSDLVNDLSMLAKAERGILDVDLAMVDPNQLVNELAESYREKAEDKGLELHVATSDHVEPIFSSESHIREILQNYVENAIKYTSSGSVTLTVKPDEEDASAVVFAVEDTGIGISSTDKKHINEKFYRSEDYRTRETGGTGLGLYVTEKLAERLSGQTWFESKLNKGSTFYLRVPSVSGKSEDRSKATDAQMNNLVSSL